LKPGTSYRYRIYSQEVLSHKGTDVLYGKAVASDVFRNKPFEFVTNDITRGKISFVMLNDIHERNEVMENLLKGTDWQNTDLVLFNGDMVNDLRSEDQLFGSFMDTAVRLFATKIPMYYARGNHETRGNFATAFPDYFPGPSGNLYYLFRQGPVCFVVLDCGEDKPDSDIEYSGIVAFDDYREKEVQWLKEVLQSDTFNDAFYKVVVAHIPPFGGWHGEQEVAERFVPLLNAAGADVMLCGHLHRYVRQNPKPGQDFPVIVNSNNTVLKAYADRNSLEIKILNLKGALVDSLVIHPKH
jgi:3',5'-cyclic AMP phosphodiesterase CpdA